MSKGKLIIYCVMKKVLLSLFIFVVGLGSVSAQSYLKNYSVVKHKTLHTGFVLKAGLFSPASKFGYAQGETVDENIAKKGFNFQVGTCFYITPVIAKKLRIGLDAHWLDISYALLDMGSVSGTGSALNLGFLGVGPIVSFSPTEKIAFDAYYKIMPTFGSLIFDNGSSSETYGGLGFTSVYGAGFRFSVLYVGAEYNSGKVDYKTSDELGVNPGKLFINNMRIFVGVRF